MSNSVCAICGGTVKRKKISIDRLVDGHLYLFENVFVSACTQCGEVWIPAALAERMDKAIHGKIKPKRRINVPVY